MSSETVDRIYETISEWRMTPLEMVELAGRLSRDGLEGITKEVRTSLGVDPGSGTTPRKWTHLAARAADERGGMTLDELTGFVELVNDNGVPGESRIKVTVGFGGQLRGIETRSNNGESDERKS